MQMNIDEKRNENHAIYNDIREELTKNNLLHLILTKILTSFESEITKEIAKTGRFQRYRQNKEYLRTFISLSAAPIFMLHQQISTTSINFSSEN